MKHALFAVLLASATIVVLPDEVEERPVGTALVTPPRPAVVSTKATPRELAPTAVQRQDLVNTSQVETSRAAEPSPDDFMFVPSDGDDGVVDTSDDAAIASEAEATRWLSQQRTEDPESETQRHRATTGQ